MGGTASLTLVEWLDVCFSTDVGGDDVGKHTHGIAFPFVFIIDGRDVCFSTDILFVEYGIASLSFYLSWMFVSVSYLYLLRYNIALSLGMFVFSVPTFVCDLGGSPVLASLSLS